MLTPWGAALDENSILQEYPRPQLRRESYLNLNGRWDCAFTPDAEPPERFDETILVPFSPEAELSGVRRALEPGEYLWYRRRVRLPEGFKRARLLLHFGAVDQLAEVFVNGTSVRRHTGGCTPFSADITDAVGSGGEFELSVRVQDFTEALPLARGKQSTRPGGIWYTAQSGIWQTVWLESVPENYIKGLRLIPHFDEKTLEVWVAGEGECRAVIDGVQEHSFTAGAPAVLPVGELEPWSPETPRLHELTLTLGEDRAESYFAMRKFTAEKAEDGEMRLFLNGKPYFHNGLLDQGYWPDGLMTAPSDDALIFDIQTAKAMGFNTLRKHMKCESLRWYYHCDRLGMIVWQDMPSGGGKYSSAAVSLPLVTGHHMRDNRYRALARADEAGRRQFVSELREMVGALYNCPCIAMWVPFNEGWGQFDAAEICAMLKRLDPTRLVDHASGWHDQGAGDVCSRHVYFKKYRFRPDGDGRAVVLSEYGGYNFRIEGHSQSKKDFGYRRFSSANSYRFALRDLFRGEIAAARAEGLAAAIYTQLSDVEGETNGLVTYDRRFLKIPAVLMKGIAEVKND